MRLTQVFAGVLGLLSFVASSPLWLSPVRFQEFDLFGVDVLAGNITAKQIATKLCRMVFDGIEILVRAPFLSRTPVGDAPEDLFAFVYSWLPSHCAVYPTEGFYYYRARVSGSEYWGNFRLADGARGSLTFAWFGPESKVRIIHKKVDDDQININRDSDKVVVRYHGRLVTFIMPDTTPPMPAPCYLRPNERAIASVHDESATHFVLVFNDETNSFYYFLDPNYSPPEALLDLQDGLRVGSRSGFVYAQDGGPQRILLVAVRSSNIKANNFFDGPGDQVPYDLDVRDMLYRAYPHTQLRDGVDQTGVYVNRDKWTRVAIAPYLRYNTANEIRLRLASCSTIPPENRATALTKESWNNAAWQQITTQRLRDEGKLKVAASEGDSR